VPLQEIFDVAPRKQPRPPSYSHVSDLPGGAHLPKLSWRDAQFVCGLFKV
jgi:hypothetical protein